MPLGVLITLVVLGIAGIAALTWALGLAKPRRFANADEARLAFAREYPETPVHDVVLCQNASAALLNTAHGPAVVWPMGADSTARLLAEAQVDVAEGNLRIALPDYTAPKITLQLDPAEASLWAQQIKETR